MFNLKGIDHINMKVKDLRKSIDFYAKLFGFEVKEEGLSEMSNSKYAIIGISEKAMLCIYEDRDLKKNDKSHIAHFGFNISYSEDIIKSLKDNGVEIVYYNRSGMIDYSESQSIYIKDPSGYEIELSSEFAGKL